MEPETYSSVFFDRANVLLTAIEELNRALHHREHLNQQGALIATAKLLSEAEGHIRRISRGAPRFNIFEALGVIRKELFQSRFLAFLLSPTAAHQQGDVFLRAFLKAIPFPLQEIDFAKGTIVQTELSIGINGRLDIVVSGPSFLIAVENKVDAGEQDEQIPRYLNWLKSADHGVECKYRELVFLTPNGYKSASGIGLQYRQMSYLELASILDSVTDLVNVEPVRISVEQYVTACRVVSLGMNAMTKIDRELLTLLTSQEHLATALELQNQMAAIRGKAAQDFTDHVVEFLDASLNSAGVIAAWIVEKKNNSETAIQIRPKNLADGQRSYFLVHSGLVSSKGWGWYGWQWPMKGFDSQKTGKKAEMAMARRMIELWGGETDSVAIWYRQGKRDVGAYDLTNNEDMMIIIEDNRTDNHPLAKGIADQLSKAFFEWKDEIEKLPSFISQ